MTLINVAFSPNGGCQDAIVQVISNTRQDLVVADYSFTNQAIAQAIVDAKARNVPIRIVLDRSETHGPQANFHDQFESAGISIRLYDPPNGIMHNKFLVSDKLVVENGSYNYTEKAERYNRENIQVHQDASLAAQYLAEFEKIWQLAGPETSRKIMRPVVRTSRAIASRFRGRRF